MPYKTNTNFPLLVYVIRKLAAVWSQATESIPA